MGQKEKLMNALFVGKVSELLGIDRTASLMKESRELVDRSNGAVSALPDGEIF